MQVLRALKDGLDAYLYRSDTNSARVKVSRGGTAGSIHDLGGGVFGVYISLLDPLAAGQTASLEYTTLFRYRDAPTPGVPTKLHPQGLQPRDASPVPSQPAATATAVGLVGQPRREDTPPEVVQLDREHSAHRYLTRVESTIVGFTWDWDGPTSSG